MNVNLTTLVTPDAGSVVDAISKSTVAENWYSYANIANFSSIAGLIISIVGLVITSLTLKTASEIAARYLLQARMPELLNDIDEHCRAVSKYYGKFETSKDEIELELAKCGSTLKNLEGKVNKTTKQSVKSIVEKIKNRSRDNRDETWNIYIALIEINGELKQLQKDRSWSDKNAA